MEKKRFIIAILIIIIFIILIILSSIYYKDKYKISFETGTDDVILSQYISKNSKIEEPEAPFKTGYVFIEWQKDGQKYDFNNEVENDIVLSAKWAKEEYIKISYITNSIYEIDSIYILKGTSINNLPIAYKDNYEFIGWYLGDKLYDGQTINSDTTLIAKYKNDKINTTYKVGDSVKITGNYSSSAFNINAIYSAAIGWDRTILDILIDTEYPYVVGNNEGVTGFFKANSLKLN